LFRAPGRWSTSIRSRRSLDGTPICGWSTPWALLVLIELVYVLKRVISPSYLADAVVELGFIGWWVASLA
jgi:hypothetical protein